MLVEGPQRDWLAFGHVVVQPTAVDLSEGNASGTIDRIGQPDISVEEIGGHRNQFAVKIQKKRCHLWAEPLQGCNSISGFSISEIPPGKRKVTVRSNKSLFRRGNAAEDQTCKWFCDYVWKFSGRKLCEDENWYIKIAV